MKDGEMIRKQNIKSHLPVNIMDTFTVSEKKGNLEVFGQVNVLGDDLLVILFGGVEHIGAVGMAQPRPSLSDPEKSAATSTVFTYIGHKEDIIVKAASEALAKNLNRKTVVAAGIHWDDLKPEDIENVAAICDALIKKVIIEMRKRPDKS